MFEWEGRVGGKSKMRLLRDAREWQIVLIFGEWAWSAENIFRRMLYECCTDFGLLSRRVWLSIRE